MSWLADIAIAALLFEVAMVALFRRIHLRAIIAGALPGLCLLLALRAAIMDAAWPTVAALLAASLPFHLIDLRMRMKG